MSVSVGPGSTFAGYRIESLVGRGGMGVVYRATDLSLDRPVALKLVAPELAEDERFRTRFANEPRLAAALDHPHVVPIYEAGEHEGRLFLAMRYVEGSELKTVLEREGSLGPERALPLLAQVADALDAAHRRGLVHRDVKPANVLLDDESHAYLTDFGISKQSGGRSLDTQVAGTLDYLAPEQIRGEEVDGRTDGYALACVLYECLAGTRPFRRESEAEVLWAHMHDQPPPLRRYPELDGVLARGLAKEKAGRYASCRELVDAASSALGFEAPARRARRLRIGRRLLFAGAGLLLACAAAAVVLALPGDGERPVAPPAVAPDSLAVLDPASNSVIGEVRIPGRPSLVAARDRSVWVSDMNRALSQVDAQKLSVTKVVPVDASPEDLVATGDAVWLLDGEFHAPVNTLVKVDSADGSVAERVALPAGRRRGSVSRRLLLRAGRGGVGADVGRDAVWVAAGTRRLLKLDRRDAGVVRAFDLRRPLIDVAVSEEAVWGISGASARVLELDPRSGSVRAAIPITGRPGSTKPIPVAVAAGHDAVWVLNRNTPSVTRIDPQLSAVTATIPLGVGSNPTAVATGAGAVWVAMSGVGAVARIDPSTGAVRSIPVGGAPTGVAVGNGKVWIAVQPGFRAGLAGRARRLQVPGAISERFCTPVEFAGDGKPQVLIVSDLPLQYPVGGTPTLQLADAVRFVLARREFRAGRYSVGYQSCDHSNVGRGSGWTPATCRRNARAIAAAPTVLGVVGPYNSGCVAEELPVLNRARGGPVADISGSATVVGLTHRGAGTLPGEPESYYPRGVRNFARVLAADDVQGAADAIMAKRLGVKRLYVLSDLEGYGIAVAANVRAATRDLGLAIAGTGSWDVADRGYRDLARRIERSRADGVFLGGILPAGGARLVRDLRAVLGPRFHILAPDGFSEMNLLVDGAGRAAEGVVISIPIVPSGHLPPSGRRFVEAFERAIGGRASPYFITTAQATAVLLDAIAASDGSRASVARNLFGKRVENGILDDFEIDANGDTTAGGVTMYRIDQGKARVMTVLTPPSSLVP